MKKGFVGIALALGLLLAFTLAGCASSGSGNSTKNSDAGCEVTLDKAFICGSYDGTPLLVVNLNVKNNSNRSISAYEFSSSSTATIDGKELEASYLSTDNPNALDYTASIEAGGEGTAQLVFSLEDDPEETGTVSLVVKAESTDYSKSVEVLNTDIDLASIEKVVSQSDYTVSIDSATVTDDGEGTNLLVMTITFANNGKKATSFGSAIRTQLFQSGVEMKSSYLPYNHPLYDEKLSSNTYTEIQGGNSIQCQIVYALNDATGKVEVKCMDNESYDMAAILDKTIDISSGAASTGAATSSTSQSTTSSSTTSTTKA